MDEGLGGQVGEGPELLSLVAHGECVQARATVERVFEGFRHHDHEFAAVLDERRFLGLVSRGQLGFLLGTRFGFALYSGHPIMQHLLPEPLVVAPELPLLEVLEAALDRDGEGFYHDLAVVAADGAFLGIIPVPALVRAQSQLMLEKIRQVGKQGQELEQSFALNEKSAMLETLVGGIAHELNNKLAPVLGYAELLGLKLRGAAGFDDQVNHCQMIVSSVRESGKIIQQLRHLSRPLALECTAEDLATLIEHAEVLVRFRLRASGAKLVLELPSPCPKIRVDPSQIKQVLVNLILNGLDAMEHVAEKRMWIRAVVQPETLTLEIQDTGEGIPPEKLTRIFDPYFTTKSMDKGSGLGLSLCLGIVKQHKGGIRVESTVGRGTSFFVTLPLARGQAAEAAAGPADPAVPATPQRLRGMVVDDEEAITALVRDSLTLLPGWQVTRVHSGEEALIRISQTDFDLLITDLRMPGLDGFAVLDWVRRERPRLYARTMIITGDAGGARQDQDLARLNRPVLRKPFSTLELQRMCTALCAGDPSG